MSWFGLTSKKTASSSQQPRQFSAEPRILRLGWLGMKVADVITVSVFMEEQLGLPFIEEGNTYAGHHVRYDCGRLELELVSGGTTWATRPKPRRGQPDVPLVPSFSVDNIQQVAERLNEKDLPATQLFEQGWATSFYFFDPERNLWQVHEKRTEAASGTTELRNIGVIWLACEDLAAQINFYQNILGLPLLDDGGQDRPITAFAEQQQLEEPTTFADYSSDSRADSDVFQENVATDESIRAAKTQQGAVFLTGGVHLALSPGGVKLPNNAPRVWGKDTPFLPGLLTNNLQGMASRLTAAGLKISGPYPHISTKVGFDPRYPTPTQAIRFHDPEGQPWQIYG